MSKGVDGVITTYVVAVLGLPHVLVETTGGSSTYYLHGHDLLAEEGTAWAWHLGDGLGSVRQLADGDGDVTLAQGYTPFGVLLWSEGSGASGYGFTGEQQDASFDMLFLRARWMDPASGRFISPDPIIPDFNNPQSLNRYIYVYNNPLNYVDPSGHQGLGFGARLKYELLKNVLWVGSRIYWPLPIEPFVSTGAPLASGRWVVEKYRAEFHWSGAAGDLVHPTLLAAAVAHQSNDPLDRFLGTDIVDKAALRWYDPNASVGVAQIRPIELLYVDIQKCWVTEESTAMLFDPEFSIHLMALKLQAADEALGRYPGYPETDRYMLLAVAQNIGRPSGIAVVVDTFFSEEVGRRWPKLFDELSYAQWQLQLMLIEFEYLVGQGWPLPEGLDLDRWRYIAFEGKQP